MTVAPSSTVDGSSAAPGRAAPPAAPSPADAGSTSQVRTAAAQPGLQTASPAVAVSDSPAGVGTVTGVWGGNDPWQVVTRRDRDPEQADRAAKAWAAWAAATGAHALLGQSTAAAPSTVATELSTPATAAADSAAWAASSPTPAAVAERESAIPVVDVLREAADAGLGRRRREGGRSWLRALTLGLVDPAALEVKELELALLDAARAPQLGPRVIGVVSGKGGVGASTTAAGVVQTLAALREDKSVLVDVHGVAARPPGWLSRPELAEIARAPRFGWPVASPAEHSWDGVGTSPGFGGSADGRWWPSGQGAWWSAVEENSFTVIDLGNDLSVAAQDALSTVDQVIVVTTPEPDAVASVEVAIERVAQVGPGLTTAAVAVVCMSAVSLRRVERQLQGQLAADLTRMVVVPYDPALADGEVDLARLRPDTRHAFLTLAAMVGDAR
jgi:hypothetical protein